MVLGAVDFDKLLYGFVELDDKADIAAGERADFLGARDCVVVNELDIAFENAVWQPADHARLEVEKQPTAVGEKLYAVESDPVGCGDFDLRFRIVQNDGVFTYLGNFVFLFERTRIVLFHGIARKGNERRIAAVGTARARKVGLTERENALVVVVVARAIAPCGIARFGAWLNHAERSDNPGVSVPRARRADFYVYKFRAVFRAEK